MSSLVYRMRVYEPRSGFPPTDGDTVLTPTASFHSEPFAIATSQSISSASVTFRPYMGKPSGRKNKLDPVKKKLTIGNLKVMIGDQKITTGSYATGSNTDNLRRWVTAFVGNETGENPIKGFKVYIEESTDSGSTWNPYFIGRIDDFSLSGHNAYEMLIKGEEYDLKKAMMFEQEPSASVLQDGSYGNRFQLLPHGPDNDYGPFPVLRNPIGYLRNHVSPANRWIDPEYGLPQTYGLGAMWISKPLLEQVPQHGSTPASQIQSDGLTGPILRLFDGSEYARYYVTYLEIAEPGFFFNVGFPVKILSILLEEIPSGSFEYQPIDHFAADTAVSFQIISLDGATKNNPALIDDVHPAQYWKDICNGAFFPLNTSTGTPYFKIDIDETEFDLLIANESFRDFRAIYTEPIEAKKVIEEDICQVYDLGYRMEPTESDGRVFSKMVPFTMSLPETIAGIPTITTEDLVAGSNVSWEPGEPFLRYEAKFYRDHIRFFEQFTFGTGGGPEENLNEGLDNPSLLSETERKKITADVDAVHAGDKVFKQDMRGLRYMPGELDFVSSGGPTPLPIPRQPRIEAEVDSLQDEQVFRWSRGPSKVTITTHRTGSTNTLKIGEFRLLSIDFLPDPFQHQRGGTRVMQCVETREEGLDLVLSFVDSGINAQSSAPTVNQFVQISGSGGFALSAVSGAVEVSNRLKVIGGYAATDQSVATRPDATSSTWRTVYSQIQESGSTDVTFGGLPDGTRIWPRFRTRVPGSEALNLPSDWVYGDSVDLDAIPAPTNLVVSQITDISAHLEWTPGASTGSTEIRMKPAQSASLERTALLPVDASQIDLEGLTSESIDQPWTVGVRHIGANGGVSTEITASFTASNPPDEPPDDGGIVYPPPEDKFIKIR